MRTIELDVFERTDLVKYLERLKGYILSEQRNIKSTNPHDRWDNTKYDIMRIERLIDIIEGRLLSLGYCVTKPPKNENKDDDKDDLFSFLKE